MTLPLSCQGPTSNSIKIRFLALHQSKHTDDSDLRQKCLSVSYSNLRSRRNRCRIWVCFFVSMPRECLKVIRSPLNGQKAPDRHPGPDRQTDRRTCLNGSKPRPVVNAKCDVVMKLSVFGTRTDTHTRQNLHIHTVYILVLRAVINNISRKKPSVPTCHEELLRFLPNGYRASGASQTEVFPPLPSMQSS